MTARSRFLSESGSSEAVRQMESLTTRGQVEAVVPPQEFLSGVHRVTRPDLIAAIAGQDVLHPGLRCTSQEPGADFDPDVTEWDFHFRDRLLDTQRFRLSVVDFRVLDMQRVRQTSCVDGLVKRSACTPKAE